MSAASAAQANDPLPHEPSPVAAVLSYLIPGLGQISQGRYGKGVLFMVSLLGMFFLGQAMGQWQNVYVPPDFLMEAPQGGGGKAAPRWFVGAVMRLHYLGQFWIGVAAWPALWQYYHMPVPKEDDMPFWHNFQRMPDETKLNRYLVKTDKTPDLGWVYTVIAGMLNILVIYDAYAGPALTTTQKPADNKAAPAVATAAGGAA
jgi:hypothetical protein